MGKIVSLEVALQTINATGNGGFTFDNKVFLDSNFGEWQSYNLTTNEIKPIDNIPAERYRFGIVQFLIGKKGYVGMGDSLQFAAGTLYTNFWELDFTSGRWTQISDIPVVFRTNGVGFTMNGKGYVLTGYVENDIAYPGFREYNPDTDEWKRLSDFGRGDSNARLGFEVNGIAYGGLGENMQGELRQEFWKFIPELD